MTPSILGAVRRYGEIPESALEHLVFVALQAFSDGYQLGLSVNITR
jgi:hypothetical protein